MNEHDRYDELVAPYLLDAIEDDERLEFEAHLETCASCRDEIEFLRVGVDAIPGSVPQVEPPPELRDRIMSVVRSEAELLAAAGPQADRVPEPRRERRPFWSGWRVAAPLAGALAAAALAVAVVGDGDGDGSGTQTVIAAQAPAGSSVRVLVGEEHSTLVAEDLPAPPRGRVYQVWLKRPGKAPEPTRALFRPSESGTVSVDVPGSIDGVEDVLVTHEPIGGSQVPSGPPLITVEAS